MSAVSATFRSMAKNCGDRIANQKIVLRDKRKRELTVETEVQRRAYLFVARNTTLPATIRHRAQLGLNTMGEGHGRLTAVRNRCVETGRGRGGQYQIAFHIINRPRFRCFPQIRTMQGISNFIPFILGIFKWNR